MAATEKIQILFEAKGAGRIQNALNRVFLAQTQLTKSQKQYEKALKGLNNRQKRVVDNMFAIQTQTRNTANAFSVLRSKLLLISFAATIVTKAFITFVEMAGKQEASVIRLALIFGEGARGLDEYSSALQAKTGYADEDINVMMSQIAAFGANEKQTKELASATLDLAAALNLDLNSAGLLIAKTIGSTTDALTRYGVGALGATKQTEKVANVISSIEEKFGGLAEAMGKTTSGQLRIARAAFGDLGEELGKVLAPVILAISRALVALVSIMKSPALASFLASVTLIAFVMGAAAIHAGALALATRAATIAMSIFNAVAGKNPYIMIALAALTAAAAIHAYASAHRRNTTDLDKWGRTIEIGAERLARLKKETGDNIDALRKKRAMILASTEAQKAAIQAGRELEQVEISLIEEIGRLTEAKRVEEALLNRIVSSYNSLIDVKIMKLEADLAEIEMMNMFGHNLKVTDEVLRGSYEAIVLMLDKLIKKRGESSKSATKEQELMKTTTSTLKKQSEALELRVGEEKKWKMLIGMTVNNLRELTEVEKLELKVGKDAVEAMKGKTDSALAYAESIDKINESVKRNIANEQLRSEVVNNFKQLLTEVTNHNIEEYRRQAQAKIDEINRAQDTELESLRQEFRYRKATDKQKKAMEQEIINRHDADRKIEKDRANNDMKEQFAIQQAISITEAVINTAVGISKALAQGGFLLGIPMAAAIAAMGAVQISLIKSQKPPKMQYGGLIGGNRHSQGGTMIEAEQGEFVVSRDGVQAAGLEALNRINEGGLGGDQSDISRGIVSAMDAISVASIASQNPPTHVPQLSAVASPFGVPAQSSQSSPLLSAATQPQTQYGGLVGGNRHSRGGTTIEAERGEFVVSRTGVQATGIEALNRINSGELGRGGGTTININNPILSKDIIEDDIIPQIKEAIRRGGDIGI